ncbi:outer membrane protein assembly factor BamB family protein [Halocatena marina]|uniref:outer membrane protein assembly factor BamB family protein n=1 Tax=Halocatena marina TaxID=2934937 RepID=UPI00200DD203|nr:PQQ-binding-like beta-propeller repeat protein [Halocatena marina]
MPSKRSTALNRRKLLTVATLSISSSIAGCATLQARLEAFRLGTFERPIAADWHLSPGQWPMRDYNYARTRHNPFATPPRHNPVRAWTYAVSSSNLQSLVVSDDTVFVRSEARLTALNATDGRKRWHRSRNNRERLIYIAGRLYNVAQDRVRAIAPDGTELWSTELNRE